MMSGQPGLSSTLTPAIVVSLIVLWDSDPLQLAVHSCSKSGLLWWIVQPMLLPLLPYKRLCVEDTIRLSCEWPAGHLFLCRLSLRIRLRCILPSIWILSKDMKLFMVVTLILLAPFPQSSVRARVSLTLSLTFQWDLVLSPTLNWLAMACMRLRPLPLRLVWLSSEELPLIIKALGLCAPLLLHFVRVNPLPSRSSSNDSNLSVRPGSGHNWSGRDSPRSSMKFKSDPLAAVVFQDLLWLGLGQLALALLHLINGGLKLYVIGLSLQFDFWLWRILSGVYKHMIASSCADLRTEQIQVSGWFALTSVSKISSRFLPVGLLRIPLKVCSCHGTWPLKTLFGRGKILLAVAWSCPVGIA